MSIRVYAVFDSKSAADLAAMRLRGALPQAHIRTWQNGAAADDHPANLPYWAVNNAGGPTGQPNYYAPYPVSPLDLRSAASDAAGRETGGGALCAQVRSHEEAVFTARLLRERGGSGVRQD